jgi:CheY-like chemotaxis protein
MPQRECDLGNIMNLTGKNLLVIDDDSLVRQATSILAQNYGMIVSVAENGQAGIDFLKEHEHVDMVIVDLLMPDVTGWDVLRFLEQHPREHPPFVVIMSSAPIQQAEQERLTLQGGRFLSKETFTVDQFESLLSDAFPDA